MSYSQNVLSPEELAALYKECLPYQRPKVLFQLVDRVDWPQADEPAGSWYVIRGKDGSDVVAQFDEFEPHPEIYISGPYQDRTDGVAAVNQRAKARKRRRTILAAAIAFGWIFLAGYALIYGVPSP